MWNYCVVRRKAVSVASRKSEALKVHMPPKRKTGNFGTEIVCFFLWCARTRTVAWKFEMESNILML